MERAIRVKVEAGERMRTFCLAHPDEDPGFRLVQTGFEERLQRIGALALQEAHERRNATTAFRRKRALRLQLQSELLTHLARVSEVAARERPELADRFRLPTSPQAFRPFLTAATAIIEEADSLAELLVKHGMSETMFRELRATMAQLEAATETARRTRLVHVRARSELAAVAGEMMDLVKVLDGLNRYRFRASPNCCRSGSARATWPQHGPPVPATMHHPPDRICPPRHDAGVHETRQLMTAAAR